MKPVLSIYEQEHFSPQAMARLKEHFTLNGPWAPCVDLLWTRFRVPDLERYSSLKLIACNCTDESHLPLAECQRRGIEVLSLKGIEGLDTVHATAEHTIGLMLQALRHGCDRTSGRIGRELDRTLVGIVGFGRIGCKVMQLTEAFGAMCVGMNDWQFNRCDIVSIHASLNETSKGMINAEFLSKLKPGCILVNTARDAIVDRREIMYWLERDQQAMYAHDFSDEWPLGHERIIGTPHIGGWTIESLHKTEELLAERVIEWAKTRLEVPCG